MYDYMYMYHYYSVIYVHSKNYLLFSPQIFPWITNFSFSLEANFLVMSLLTVWQFEKIIILLPYYRVECFKPTDSIENYEFNILNCHTDTFETNSNFPS